MPGFPIHHQLPEPAQPHVHWVSELSESHLLTGNSRLSLLTPENPTWLKLGSQGLEVAFFAPDCRLWANHGEHRALNSLRAAHFSFFSCNILRKSLNKLFGQPNAHRATHCSCHRSCYQGQVRASCQSRTYCQPPGRLENTRSRDCGPIPGPSHRLLGMNLNSPVTALRKVNKAFQHAVPGFLCHVSRARAGSGVGQPGSPPQLDLLAL